MTLRRWQALVKGVPSYWTLDFHEQVAAVTEGVAQKHPNLLAAVPSREAG